MEFDSDLMGFDQEKLHLTLSEMICHQLLGDLKVQETGKDVYGGRDRHQCTASFIADICNYQGGKASAPLLLPKPNLKDALV